MSSIDIRHDHAMTPTQARKAVGEVAQKLSERFGVDYAWEDGNLHFKRPGVDGVILLGPKSLQVHAKLGFLLSALKGPIEHEIRRYLDERF